MCNVARRFASSDNLREITLESSSATADTAIGENGPERARGGYPNSLNRLNLNVRHVPTHPAFQP